jgi:2-oxo-4-hydroxy-4-carboxy-5-ureidoimidazoline decarboxylase
VSTRDFPSTIGVVGIAAESRNEGALNEEAPSEGAPGLGALDAAPAEEAELGLLACCASPRWAATVLAARPYADLDRLTAVSDAALAALDWGDIEQALSGHPRIGERAEGAGREADWSRREQSAAATGDAEVRAALTAGNAEYELHFGHVFLICATGRPAGEILAALHQRLGNDEATERDVVRAELAAIVRLRLAELAAG